MLAIALVLEGVDRKTAAETCGMNRQTLRDWVHRYNAERLSGLSNRRSPGRPPWLTPAQKAALAALVEQGPDPERDGVVRWRRKDLKRRIEEMFGVVMQERTVGAQLAELGFVRLTARPRHPKPDEAAPGGMQKDFPAAVAEIAGGLAKGKMIEVGSSVWFASSLQEQTTVPSDHASAYPAYLGEIARATI
ncbi:hypothetical protein CEJ86_29965 [Sinorhizobium meliloti]|uniref:Uncharacterized protein n=2 Tax=Rhizobium meliloti TaxID=382 RepID=A0A2J0YUA6_RHIML|nr:hypothetical protein CEJ86_29965 [Sinorhizobium meliloti]